MIYELVRQFKGEFKAFQPYTTAKDRTSWDGLTDSLKVKWITLGELCLNVEYPPLSANSYMEFCNIGDRIGYEEKYFTRRRLLYTLVMAECIEGKKRFLKDIANGIIAICEESGWQLPAHNHFAGVHSKLADVTKPVMDLFACETAAGLAMVSYLLKEELDEISPVLCSRIQYEIKQRILTPYLDTHFFWMGKDGEKVNNWTAWCTQNTLIALFSIGDMTQETMQKVMEKAAKSLDIFLDSYGIDGCCNEGASYYRVAGLCLFNALEVMNFVTDNSLLSIYEDEKIRNMAPYIFNVHIAENYYANFADCAPTCERAGAREYLFAKRTGNVNMMHYAAKDFKEDSNTVLPRQSVNLFYYLQSVFTEKEIQAFDSNGEVEKKDIYYESVGLLLARDSGHFLAVKAGGNDDSHNHNDTGSIIFYKNGQPVLIDIGVETYSRKTFSNERYDIWTMQSAYHNVLSFGKVMQKYGSEYQSKVSEILLTDDKAIISMELSGCYPYGCITGYTRKVEFVKEKYLRVTDTIEPYKEGTFLSLMTIEVPTWKDNILFIGQLEKLYFNSKVHVVIEEIEIEDGKLKKEWGNSMYRTKIFPDSTELIFTVKLD
ncbi:MAG: heparinase II/III family protein [Anaerocolumna sp.]